MSRRFILIAAALIIVTLLGLIVVMIAIATTPMCPDCGGMYNPNLTELWVTNSFIGTAIAQTATAKAYTATPPPTPLHKTSF